jgi:uncharacterized coiled-coil protein SlyX
VAVGNAALYSNTAGYNTALGSEALDHNTTGSINTPIGRFAGTNATTGDGNVYLGAEVMGVAGESNHTYIRNIDTTTVSGGNADYVTVDTTTGLLGHLSSSRRYKEEIKPMENASETLYRLKPVMYRYKKEIDPSQSLDYGLVAEDVASADPNLANRNRSGQVESVRYNAINAMLLNEFLKEHRKGEEQECRIHEQEMTIAEVRAEMKHLATTVAEQALQIQKVSTQLERNKTSSQTVLNDRSNPATIGKHR